MNRRTNEDDGSPERWLSYRKDKRFRTDKQSNYIQQSNTTPPRGSYYDDREKDRRSRPLRDPKPDRDWTPLNRSLLEIIKEVKGKPYYYPPKPLLALPENHPRDKHCSYHEKAGRLRQSSCCRKTRGQHSLWGARSPPRCPDGGDDVMMIQSYQEEPIYFTYSDYECLDPDHNDALVVTLDIAENEVKRILVDNGSSANVILEHTLNKMWDTSGWIPSLRTRCMVSAITWSQSGAPTTFQSYSGPRQNNSIIP